MTPRDPVKAALARRLSDNRRRGKPTPPPQFTRQVSLALLLDYEALKTQGYTIPLAAQKLGVSRSTINRTIRRFR